MSLTRGFTSPSIYLLKTGLTSLFTIKPNINIRPSAEAARGGGHLLGLDAQLELESPLGGGDDAGGALALAGHVQRVAAARVGQTARERDLSEDTASAQQPPHYIAAELHRTMEAAIFGGGFLTGPEPNAFATERPGRLSFCNIRRFYRATHSQRLDPQGFKDTASHDETLRRSRVVIGVTRETKYLHVRAALQQQTVAGVKEEHAEGAMQRAGVSAPGVAVSLGGGAHHRVLLVHQQTHLLQQPLLLRVGAGGRQGGHTAASGHRTGHQRCAHGERDKSVNFTERA